MAAISNLARSLLEDFVDFHSLSYADAIVTKKLSKPSVFVTDFFRFCAQIFTPADQHVEIDAHVVSTNLQEFSDTDMKRTLSRLMWFIDSQGRQSLTILIDFNWLSENLTIDAACRKRNRLVILQIGHLVLHRDLLRSTTKGFNIADNPSRVQTAEATWFCHVIIGLLASQIATEDLDCDSVARDRFYCF